MRRTALPWSVSPSKNKIPAAAYICLEVIWMIRRMRGIPKFFFESFNLGDGARPCISPASSMGVSLGCTSWHEVGTCLC